MILFQGNSELIHRKNILVANLKRQVYFLLLLSENSSDLYSRFIVLSFVSKIHQNLNDHFTSKESETDSSSILFESTGSSVSNKSTFVVLTSLLDTSRIGCV